MNPLHEPFPADGHTARWVGPARTDDLTVSWENEAWTLSGVNAGPDAHDDVQYVIRLSPLWQVRQVLVFRDLDEPDLWLGTDGRGRWGEVNGAHRVDLDGALDVAFSISPYSHLIPIRRLALAVGQEAPTITIDIDVDTLGAVPSAVVYRRTGEHSYEAERSDSTARITVDRHGLPIAID